MLYVRYLFYFIFLQLIAAIPQINLYYTDLINTNESIDVLQHDCLRIKSVDRSFLNYQVITYCMSESSLKFNTQLAKQHISSQQLYLWSTSIDIIEPYQFYLNQLLTSNDLSLETEIFYNCTLPRFGPICQYELEYYNPNYESLFHLIKNFYEYNPYQPINLTCYIHLQCNRGPGLGCLDWSEICDGYINCLNDGVDKEHCWQLEINDCNDKEYRCHNGQCIPWEFFQDSSYFPDCIDWTDERQLYNDENDSYFWSLSDLIDDDTICRYTFLSSSCLISRHILLVKTLLSIKENNGSDDCWSTFICSLQIFDKYCINFNDLNGNIRTAEHICPDMLKIPSVPVLFGDIYFMYIKK